MSRSIRPSRPNSSLLAPYLVTAWGSFHLGLFLTGAMPLLSSRPRQSTQFWCGMMFVAMVALALGRLVGRILTRRRLSMAAHAGLLCAAALATIPVTLIGSWIVPSVPTFIRSGGPFAGSVVLLLVPVTMFGSLVPYATALLTSSRGRMGPIHDNVALAELAGVAFGPLYVNFVCPAVPAVRNCLISAAGISLGLTLLIWMRHPPGR